MNALSVLTKTLEPGGPLRGEVHVPGDKSISHRALMLGAVARGVTEIQNLSAGADVVATGAAVQELGAEITALSSPSHVAIKGGALQSPSRPIDVGNAGTGIRLLTGLLAGQGLYAVLFGDASLSKRPMDRVIKPLSAMGASIFSREGGFAPLTIVPSPLRGIDYVAPISSAQVKSAILLAGLGARGTTSIHEAVASRRHTEEMLAQFGAAVTSTDETVTLEPGELTASDIIVPGDPSQAAFWAVGAAIVPGSELVLPDLVLSPERAGFVEVLSRMGADIRRDGDGLVVRYNGRLHGADIQEHEVSSLIDEVPILAIAAAAANGTSEFRGLHELTVKESNRLLGIGSLLETLGAPFSISGDSIRIEGIERFRSATSNSNGDHRMTMSAAIASLMCESPSDLSGAEFVDTSYPGFFNELQRLVSGGGRMETGREGS